MSVESFGKNKLLAVFCDDYTGIVNVYAITTKDKILDDMISETKAVGHQIRRVRSDNVKEFASKERTHCYVSTQLFMNTLLRIVQLKMVKLSSRTGR